MAARGFRTDRNRVLYQRLVRLGWTSEERGSGHVRCRAPDGTAVITLSKTEADGHGNRNGKNNEAVLKRWLKAQEDRDERTDPASGAGPG